MKVDEWLSFFKKHPEKKLFSLTDLSQLTGEKKSSLSVQLTRLVQTGILERVTKLWYVNPFTTPSSEEIAMVLRYPSYLSMEYALAKQGILSQQVFTLTIITTKLPYTYTSKDQVYEYHQMRKSLFWGYTKQGTVLIAEPEKAFLDLLYIRSSNKKEVNIVRFRSLLSDMDTSEFDMKKIKRYVKTFPPKTRNIFSKLDM